MTIEVGLGIAYAVGMITYIALSKIEKYNNKTFYNIKAEYKKFKSVRDEINQNSEWFKK